MEFKWVRKKIENLNTVKKLAADLKVDSNIAKLLVQRGINTYEEAKRFFRPELSHLHNPFEMKDMHKAVTRIESALLLKEKILIYGDYDVDGTTAVATVYSFFREITSESPLIDFYIPDRYNEGYGISYKSIDYAAENKYRLVVALDCGIKADEKIKYASEKNVDFIICDHHLPGENIPQACAVLDPKRPDCSYPYKELSGCGIGFKLIQAYALKNNIDFSFLSKYLDLVVISIASDIVPITGENRVLAYYGLNLINQNPRPAVEAILRYSSLKRRTDDDQPTIEQEQKTVFTKEVTINDLVFLVGPRINAAGRISEGRYAVELLTEQKGDKIFNLAEIINITNTERKQLDSLATEEALSFIENDSFLKNSKSSVLLNENWHKGIVGIVASRLTETYYRPTIVCTKSNGLITGSARSVKDFDIYAAIDHCSDLLEAFGGHKFAAGLSLKPENFEAFKQKFENFVAGHLTEEMLSPQIEIDLELNLKDITQKFYRILKQFAPFGPGNMAPVFMTSHVYDEGFARVVGINHLKMSVSEETSPLVHFDAIAFKKSEYLPLISKGLPFKICYHIEENIWKGNVTLQLNVKDIKT